MASETQTENLGRIADAIVALKRVVRALNKENRELNNKVVDDATHDIDVAIDEIEAGLAGLW